MTVTRPAPVDLVIDSSALIALMVSETSADRVRHELERAMAPVISAATLVEASIVATARLGPEGPNGLRLLLDAAGAVTIPVDEHQAALAIEAWQRWGKGNHPAALNYGDCFSYALATHLDVPLLCIGTDFARTDVTLTDVAA